MKPIRSSALAALCAILAIAPQGHADDKTKIIAVALYNDTGSFGKGIPKVQELLGTDSNATLTALTAEEIRAGGLKNFDAVIFTGGSGSKQAEALGEEGVAKVREFVEDGGGYLGICAGAYLATEGFPWSAKILKAKTVSSKWKRGKGDVEIELTDEGKKILGDHPGHVTIRYANGPVIKASDNTALPDFIPLAYFRTEMAENDTTPGIMVGSPAIAAANFGKGRVIFCSPHPEQTEGLEGVLLGAVRWISTPHVEKASTK